MLKLKIYWFELCMRMNIILNNILVKGDKESNYYKKANENQIKILKLKLKMRDKRTIS